MAVRNSRSVRRVSARASSPSSRSLPFLDLPAGDHDARRYLLGFMSGELRELIRGIEEARPVDLGYAKAAVAAYEKLQRRGEVCS